MHSYNATVSNEFQHSYKHSLGVQCRGIGLAPSRTPVSFLCSVATAEGVQFNCVLKDRKPSYRGVPQPTVRPCKLYHTVQTPRRLKVRLIVSSNPRNWKNRLDLPCKQLVETPAASCRGPNGRLACLPRPWSVAASQHETAWKWLLGRVAGTACTAQHWTGRLSECRRPY